MSRKNTKNFHRWNFGPRYKRDNVILGETFAYLNFKLLTRHRTMKRQREREREREEDAETQNSTKSGEKVPGRSCVGQFELKHGHGYTLPGNILLGFQRLLPRSLSSRNTSQLPLKFVSYFVDVFATWTERSYRREKLLKRGFLTVYSSCSLR